MPCPTDLELRSYLNGAIGAAEQESVGRHLEDCASCIERLSTVGSAPDPLLGALKDAGPDGTTIDPAIRLMLSEPDVAVGHRIGPYEILAKLGEGGMGAVYRVRHVLLGKVFALKLLPAGRHRDPDRTLRFEREIKAVGKLEHPNIVRATDAGSHEGVPYLAMEFVEGADLARIVRKRGPLRMNDACEVVRQAAQALAHAHERGLIHRDVKPSNLLLTSDGVVKLLDLGLALASDEPPRTEPAAAPSAGSTVVSLSLTSTGLALGTRDYMAPEQAANPHGVDARADVFALGATLLFLVTGRSPSEPVSPRLPIAGVLKSMLAPSPAERFGSAREAEAALARLTAGHDLAALSRGTPPRSPRRTRLLLAAAGACALAVLLAILWQPNSEPAGEVATNPPTNIEPEPGIAIAPMPRPKAPPLGRLPMTLDESQALQREWAEHLDQRVEEPGPAGVRTVLIPPGEFELAPRYFVLLPEPYRLGSTEVTRRQFQAFVSATKYVSTSESDALLKSLGIQISPTPEAGTWKEPGFPVADDSPITHVSRADAEAFVSWLNTQSEKKYRLPTEAEWRWACRAGAATRWPFGDDPRQLAQYARYRFNSRGYPERVGTLRPNAWGLFDMLGNVREWAADGHHAYPEGRYRSPTIPSKDGLYQLCGGSYDGRTEYGEWQLGWRAMTCDASTSLGRRWWLGHADGGFRVCREP